jgi:hypothetical protein
LRDVIVSSCDGGWLKFSVEEWIAEWQRQDIIEDQIVYGEKR